MAELDKFKRRMIRAVARLLHEKKSEKELWEHMKKETGCDCRLLWERMRALTLKKLRRLLLSDDKSENVASIARMSLTDWLLFDLVLVHDKIDFIEKDVLESNKDMKPLIELFYLVQKFQIETLQGNALADAWTAATVIYNSRGHQCSPMLLQRRWYQLKEATREKFYAFWFKYRGNAKQLPSAEQFMPSRLQAAIAKRYNDVIITPFLDWDTMIAERLVILPDEFEAKMRNINFTMPIESTDNDPELILVEPIIETIDLGEESDSDQEQRSPTVPIREIPIANIKSEPIDTVISDDFNACDAEMLRAMNKQLPQKVLDATSIEEIALLESENETLTSVVSKNITTETVSMVVDAESDVVTETSEVTNSTFNDTADDVILPQISNVFGNVTNESLSKLTAKKVNEVVYTDIELKTECINALEDYYPDENETNNENDDSVMKSTHLDAEQIVSNNTDKNTAPLTINSSDEDNGFREDDNINEVINQTEDTDFNHDTDIESEDVGKSIGLLENQEKNTAKNEVSLVSPQTINSVNIKMEEAINLDENIPESRVNNLSENNVVTEDGVENVDNIEDDIICIMSEDIINKPIGIQDTAVKTTDLPLDLNFVDNGIEFVDDGIVFIDEDEDSNGQNNTGNNIRHLPIKSEADDQLETKNEEPPKFDLKLLLNPIVYTKKLDDLSIFKDSNDFDVKSKDFIDYVEKECKPLCVMSNDVTNIKQEIQDAIATSANDDLINNDYSEDSDFEDIPERYKVKTTSYLLQKPKCRTYNPIQLCKNPDFNTRLKRLPVGFFSSTRNCRLLKSCKPMTIDVNKSFENKLINGTIYLKSNNNNVSVLNNLEEEKIDESKQTVSVHPSAMAAQSLIDNTLASSKQTDILKYSNSRKFSKNKANDDALVCERSRVINLPDISQIRRINQKLLTAEVTPIRVQHVNEPSKPDVREVTNLDCDVETNAGVQNIRQNVSEVINVPDKPLGEIAEVDTKPIIIPDQNQTIIPSNIASSNASKIQDFIKQIDATGSEIAKADPKSGVFSSQVNDKITKEKNQKHKHPNGKCKRYHPAVSWLSVKRQTIMKNDDSLLTLDTLNKMLNIINGDVIVDEDGQFQYNKKQKKKASQLLKSKATESNAEGPPSKSKKYSTSISKSKDEHIIEKMRNTKKPKVKIIPGNRHDLPQMMQGHNCCHKTLIENRLKPNAACVVLSDDDDNTTLHNACESIERVVRQARELKDKTASISAVQDLISNTEVQATPMEVMETPVSVIETLKEAIETPAKEVGPLEIQYETSVSPSITSIKTNEIAVSDVESVVKKTLKPALCGSTMIMNDKKDVEKAMKICKPKKHTVHVQTSVTNSKSDCFIPNQSMQVNASQIKRKNTKSMVKPESYYKSIAGVGVGTSGRSRDELYKYQAMSCSCRLPSVSLDPPKRHIVIDGSTSCALHNQTSPNMKHKLLLMNSKNISREPSERPISLGKNKILLTTVKLPKHTQPLPEIYQNPHVIPAKPLPSGVQLILLPNGELTYFIDPGVQLNAEQISSIPIILAAVKQQLDNCTVPETSVPHLDMNNDVVNISDDESANDTCNKPKTVDSKNVDVENYIKNHTVNEESINNMNETAILESSESPQLNDQLENVNSQTSAVNENTVYKDNDDLNELPNKEGNDIDDTLNLNINKEENRVTSGENDLNINVCKESNSVNDTTLNENVNKEKNAVSDLNENINKEKNVVGDFNEIVNEENKKIDVRNDEHSESATTSTAARKTILSDLMEMSGISAEDTVSMSQENVGNGNIEAITDVVKHHNFLEQNVIPMPPLVPISNIIHETDVNATNIPELTPITSLSELKYACEQADGQFFKLDLDTGVLIPINVCIKKNTKPSLPHDVSGLHKRIAPKQVIDLTYDNDDDIIVQENKSSKPMIYNNLLSRQNYKSLLKSSRGDNNVKPIKIFKSVHTNIQRRQYRNNLKESKVCVELDKKIIRKRKQRLSQIEAKIDLVDSDAPMEEEYLMDSCDDSLDSSDDEPLALIAKRKKGEWITSANESDKVVDKINGENNAPHNDTSDKCEVRMDTTPERPEAATNNDSLITQPPTAITEVASAVTQAPSDVTQPSTDILSKIGAKHVPGDDDVDEPPQISFLSDNYDSEESQENCILGV